MFKEITFKSFCNDDKITRKIKNMTKDKKSFNMIPKEYQEKYKGKKFVKNY